MIGQSISGDRSSTPSAMAAGLSNEGLDPGQENGQSSNAMGAMTS
jgi:hypothetical protein